jgi:hypothetical protein
VDEDRFRWGVRLPNRGIADSNVQFANLSLPVANSHCGLADAIGIGAHPDVKNDYSWAELFDPERAVTVRGVVGTELNFPRT